MQRIILLALMMFILPSFVLAEDRDFSQQIIKNVTNDTIKKPKTSILIFVSFSMPVQSLENYLRDAKKINASIVIRGLIDNSFQKTFQRIAQLVKTSGGDGVELNPLWFKRFDVRKVPAVVVVPDNSNCFKNSVCKSENDYDVISGDITLSAALREIRDRGHHTKEIAEAALIKLHGNFYD